MKTTRETLTRARCDSPSPAVAGRAEGGQVNLAGRGAAAAAAGPSVPPSPGETRPPPGPRLLPAPAPRSEAWGLGEGRRRRPAARSLPPAAARLGPPPRSPHGGAGTAAGGAAAGAGPGLAPGLGPGPPPFRAQPAGPTAPQRCPRIPSAAPAVPCRGQAPGLGPQPAWGRFGPSSRCPQDCGCPLSRAGGSQVPPRAARLRSKAQHGGRSPLSWADKITGVAFVAQAEQVVARRGQQRGPHQVLFDFIHPCIATPARAVRKQQRAKGTFVISVARASPCLGQNLCRTQSNREMKRHGQQGTVQGVPRESDHPGTPRRQPGEALHGNVTARAVPGRTGFCRRALSIPLPEAAFPQHT